MINFQRLISLIKNFSKKQRPKGSAHSKSNKYTFINEFKLRNQHSIYKCGNSYKCVSIDKKGVEHSIEIDKKIVEDVRKLLSGREWDLNTASDKLESFAFENRWKFYYGYKLRFYIQDILLILVANGDAEFHKEKKKYTYIIY